MIDLLLLEESNLVLLFCYFAGVWIFLWIVAVTLDFVLFDQAAEHEDSCDFVFLDHPPKIIETVGERALGGNNLLTLNFDQVGVDIVLNLLLLPLDPQCHSRRIESHKASISIIGELLWILV
jgi:hypothetical protein